MSALRILQIAPLVAVVDERRPPLGGVEAYLIDLVHGLVNRGHEVMLAAARGSFVRGARLLDLDITADPEAMARFDSTGHRSASEPVMTKSFAAIRGWLDAHESDVDVVHAHAYDGPAYGAFRGRVPAVHTLHLPPLDPELVAAAAASGARLITVSRSNAEAWRAAGVDGIGVIANGVDVDRVPFGDRPGSHLLIAGRVSPEKGIEDAIDVANRMTRGLVIVGDVYDQDYFRTHVAPHVREAKDWRIGDAVDGALWVGPRQRSEVLALMAYAAATLMPSRWEEPFGLVAVESLAAGAPVLGYRRGALAEIIDDSCGVVVPPDDREALIAAGRNVERWSRAACRARASTFALGAMVARYEEVLVESANRRNR